MHSSSSSQALKSKNHLGLNEGGSSKEELEERMRSLGIISTLFVPSPSPTLSLSKSYFVHKDERENRGLDRIGQVISIIKPF